MDEETKKFVNPYERLQNINIELDKLEKRELEIKDMSQKQQKLFYKELQENESNQFYLIIEKEAYENSINWIEVYKKGFEEGLKNV